MVHSYALRPAWTPITIVLMVIGFMLFWPLGLVMLGYILWGDRVPEIRRHFAGMRRGFRPQCDCFRTDDPPTLHVVVELAGVDPESVEVVASGQTLLIAGVRERRKVDGARYLAMEVEYGPFERRLELGAEIDTEAATARYDRGLLKVELPVAQGRAQGSAPVEVREPGAGR